MFLSRKEGMSLIKQSRESALYNALSSVLEADLKTYREKNDTAAENEFRVNQGTIQYLKKLLKEVRSDAPSMAVFDGGFGS